MASKTHRTSTLIGLCLLLLLSCGSTTRSAALPSSKGKASWYGGRHHGGPTASGERFDKNAMTAAHRKLPFGSRVRVTNLDNGKSAVVRINDRGPFGRRERIIDVSEAAAKRLGMIGSGVARVELEVVSIPESPNRRKRQR